MIPTVKVRCVNVASKDGASGAKLDDTPENAQSGKDMQEGYEALVPIICGVVTARLPAAVECALGAELAFEARRGLALSERQMNDRRRVYLYEE